MPQRSLCRSAAVHLNLIEMINASKVREPPESCSYAPTIHSFPAMEFDSPDACCFVVHIRSISCSDHVHDVRPSLATC